MPTIDINTDALAAHTLRLEIMRKSRVPAAVRNTINRAAFDVKTNTMPKESDRFIHRKPTFFKANSKVTPAKGYDIGAMTAIVGFVPKPTGKAHSVEDLEQQEHGGNIDDRDFVPLSAARTGKDFKKNVRADMRLAMIKANLHDVKTSQYGMTKRGFLGTAVQAGVGAFILSNIINSKGNRLVMRVMSIGRKGRNTKVKVEPVYSYRDSRHVAPHATHFMETASNESAGKMDKIYIEEIEKQLARD